MRGRAGGKNISLKVSLSDTELLSVLRERAAGLLGKSVRAERVEEISESSKSDVVAHFSTSEDTVTLTGLLNQKHPIHFNLKPETKTYGNFIRFFLRELRNLSPADAAADSSLVRDDAQQAMKQLTVYLEDKLHQMNRDAQANAEDIADIVDVFSDDLEPSPLRRDPLFDGRRLDDHVDGRLDGKNGSLKPLRGGGVMFEKKSPRSARFVLDRTNDSNRKSFRLVDQGSISPRHISGFLSLEIEELNETRPEPSSVAHQLELLRTSFGVLSQKAEVNGAEVLLEFELTLDPALKHVTEFVLHWGTYGPTVDGWVDEEISKRELIQTGEDRWRIRKVVRADRIGAYGAVLYTRLATAMVKVWKGHVIQDDLQFSIDHADTHHEVEYRRQESVERYELRAALLRALSDYDRFIRVMNQLVRSKRVRGLGRYLFEITKDDAGLRRLVSEYYHRAVVELGQKRPGVSSSRLKSVVSVLQNIGIGEVVFVAPEGPHAIAGGLAQVIVGLTSALSKVGVSTTIVTPLYEEAQGSKHRSADDVLKNGVEVAGRIVGVQEVGEVRIPFGPTHEMGTTAIRNCARIAVATVYLAENEGVRVFFLRHRRLADKLYAQTPDEDQIRRSVFLCRGTLELIRDAQFGIHPQVVVTNDWLSALIPAYLKVDPRYQDDPVLRDVQSVHILHNCGRDYQGRFLSNCYGEDIWPILGLGGEHYFGMSDPHDINHLNFTAGAIFHAGKALLAVSRPYAQQLLTDEGGEGLEHLFRGHAHSLFGISNGIDLQAVREVFWRLGESARREMGLEPIMPGRFNNAKLVKRIVPYKEAAKTLVQRRHKLEEKKDAILISLVGRLAEQKGISLLAGSAGGRSPSVLEYILRTYPEVQFFIGGPPSNGDSAMALLQQVLDDLTARYPGRIQSVLNFIPHREALEITQASDFFLMPSRFEPGGITQLEALACGTPVIARRIGGLAATLVDYTQEGDRGNSFLFSSYSSNALQGAICRAVEVFQDRERKEWLIRQAALAENDWAHRAPKHLTVLQHVAGALDHDCIYPHLHGRRHLLASIRP